MQMVFYTGAQFPQEYRNDAFVAMRGSWNRRPPVGYEVVRVRFNNGKPVRFESFLSGFLLQDGSKWGHFGRPVGLAVMPDGSLLVGDDTKGVIYRVSYGKGRGRLLRFRVAGPVCWRPIRYKISLSWPTNALAFSPEGATSPASTP
jgi:hypothetical protein